MKPERDIHDLYAEAIAAETPEELDRGKLAHYPLIARRLVRQIDDLLVDQEAAPRTNPPHNLNSKKK
jgi:hypothetical protein